MTTATVSTNLDDYAPDSTAYITAAGFAEGASLTFQVVHVSDPGPDGVFGTLDDVEENLGGEGHEAWTVTDGGEGDLDGTVNGSVLTTWYVNPDDSLDATFLLTAKDADGLVASNTFTDAAGSTSKVYQHWADGGTQAADWNNNILSDAKSNYFEGEVVPHVFIYTASKSVPLVQGQTYSFVITYDYFQQNTMAGGFAYITTYNIDRQPVPLNATNPYIAPSADGTFANNGGMQGSFYTVDANITAVSAALESGSGNVQRNVTVTFEYTGATTNNGIAEIYYGLYIAEPGNVSGSLYGANAWTGGSLQTTVTVGGSGATSIQLAPSAIIVGSISGYKFGDVDGDGQWDAGEVGLQGWTIYLDADNDGTLDAGEESVVTAANGSYTFSVTPETTPYYVREVNPANSGYTQTTVNPAPIYITAADPTETNVNFGNQLITKSLTIDKLADKASVSSASDMISYTYTVTNEGNAAIANVVVTDYGFKADASDDTTLVLDSGDTDNDAALDVGETWIYKLAVGVTQTMLDAGADLVNLVTATGDDVAPAEDTETVEVAQAKSLAISKTASVPTISSVTDVLTYTYILTNEGNAAIANVVVTDYGFKADASDDTVLMLDSGDTDNDGALDVGETWIYKLTATVTQDMLDAGADLVNLVTATGDDVAPAEDTETVEVAQAKSLTIDKIADNASVSSASDMISYTYTVTNTGNAAIANVVVTDYGFKADASDDTVLMLDSGDTDNDAALDVGETWVYKLAVGVTQTMLDAGGSLTNLAKATGDDVAPAEDTATVLVAQAKSLAIEKVADKASVSSANDMITYTYTVTNEGNAAIANVVVTDYGFKADASDDTTLVLDSGDTDEDGALDVGETWVYKLAVGVTQTMLDAGADLVNLVTATGDDVAPAEDSETVEVAQAKSLTIDKLADKESVSALGEKITYTYTVTTGTGNASVSNVVVKDYGFTTSLSDDTTLNLFGGDSNDDGVLDVGETWIYKLTATVTQDMLDAGDDLVNLATAVGTGVEMVNATETVDVIQNKYLTIDKVADKTSVSATGEVITYTYTVTTGAGNASVSNVVVKDYGFTASTTDDTVLNLFGGDTDGDGALDVGESWIYKLAVGVTQTMLDAGGSLTNIAKATGDDVAPAEDSVIVQVIKPTKDGLIAPTSTTVDQYISGTATTFQDYYASQGGVIQYGIKSNKISQTNPGVFFYFTGRSEGIKAVDVNGDGKADPLKIYVDQSFSSLTAFSTTFNDIKLYKVTDVNHNGIIDFGDTATPITLSKSAVTFGTGANVGDVTVNYTPPAGDTGSLYVLSIKYSTGSVIGASVVTKPTVDYSFSTSLIVGATTTPIAGETGSIKLAPKLNAMTLDGDLGDGARAITKPQLSHVFDAAVKYWADHGVAGAELDVIKNAQVNIAAMEDYWLGEADADAGIITIDGDAAGHGWSLGLGNVSPNKVDLLSVLVHEMAHLLGASDEDMDADLAVGERVLPVAADEAPASPPLGLVGVDVALPAQAHFA